MNQKYIIISLIIFSNIALSQTCFTEQQIPASTPDSRFTINNDGTVIDKSTNLMWMRCSVGSSGHDCVQGSNSQFNWQDALLTADANDTAGYSDWRLPNLKEYQSIIERRCKSPSVNTNVFPSTSSIYWTSTPDIEASTNAWSFNSFGTSFRWPHDNEFYIRLVRDNDL